MLIPAVAKSEFDFHEALRKDCENLTFTAK